VLQVGGLWRLLPAPEQNRRGFTPDGWRRSGDIWQPASGGSFVVEGLDKDMINRGGETISADQVENLVYRLPVLAQVAAIAVPDPDIGECVCVSLDGRGDTAA
jgi:2,3-dihydroxybenzoate-AMP ligase